MNENQVKDITKYDEQFDGALPNTGIIKSLDLITNLTGHNNNERGKVPSHM